jgi:hypothetical protein
MNDTRKSVSLENQSPSEGGAKYDSEKIRMDLLPWQSLEEVAKVLAYGSVKYAPYNWSKGIAYYRLFRAAINHLQKWFRGESDDSETGLSHLAHAACCVLFLLYYELNKRKYRKFDCRVLVDLKGKRNV